MKKVSKILLVCICLLVICQNSAFAKGLYSKESATSQKTEKNDGQLLKAPTGTDPNAPDEDPKEPGTVPVSDGLWVLGALTALYTFKSVKKNKLKNSTNFY